jgi:GMP reductase
MKIIEDKKLAFSDVLIMPKRSPSISRSMIDVKRTFVDKRNDREIGKFSPLIAANMDYIGTFEMASTLSQYGCMTALHKHYTIDQLRTFFGNNEVNDNGVNDYTFYSMGISDKDLEKMEVFQHHFMPKNIVIDVANGYTDYFVERVKVIRDKNPYAFIMAGNVVSPNMVEELVLNAGVNLVKIGIGSGAACLTRVIAGVGFPQLSAVMECADAAHGLDAFICSDGGHKTAGDVSKALCGGADFVMLGGMLAGHDEGGAELITKRYRTSEVDEFDNPKIENKQFMKFHGMSSKEAMEKHNGKMETYKASEGKEVLVPYKGSVKDTILEIQGGIRSTCTYIGAKSVKEMNKRATFVKTNVQENKVFS